MFKTRTVTISFIISRLNPDFKLSVYFRRLTLDGNDHRPATANGVNGTNGINGLNGVNGEVEPPTAHMYRPSNGFVKTPSPRHEHEGT